MVVFFFFGHKTQEEMDKLRKPRASLVKDTDKMDWLYSPADKASPLVDKASPPADKASPFGPCIYFFLYISVCFLSEEIVLLPILISYVDLKYM